MQIFEQNQPTAEYFFAFAGVSLSLVFANLGAAFGTYKAGQGIASIALYKPEIVMKSLIPVVMAGILGIYGMIVSVIISQSIGGINDFTHKKAYSQFAAGLVCGLSSLGAGYAIGLVGDKGVRCFAQEQSLFVGLILILIFAEAIGLYGLIVALLLIS